MKNKVNRREFLVRGTQAGIACCTLLCSPDLHAFSLAGEEIPDPKKLNYCGYTCPPDCKFKKGSVENNVELKKEAYASWKIKERYGIEFDPEKIFCYGCKTKGKPEGVVLVNCTVRSCAIQKGFDSCIECKELTVCKKDLWTRFPGFAKQVIDMQEKYLASNNKA